ncbi:MAG: hypothetical protein JWO20_1042 [Candidatus Angelobacter sp.]|jgi:hypothetical protein|nr:hypothetical protein [Candidatus Angelobacter sp.]
MGKAKENSAFSFYKLLRLLIIIGMVGALALMLKKPGPAATPIMPEKVAGNAQGFSAKLEQLKSASERGESGAAVAFTSDEVNSFIADASVRAAQSNSVPTESRQEPVPAASQEAQADTTASSQAAVLDAAAIEQVRAAIKRTQLAFEGDEVIAQAVVQRYGQDIYVTVRGKLGVSDGYVAFTPTGFKIGSLAVPVSMVGERLHAKLAEPENRDKLKLPDFISDLRVENGQLKIVQK